MAIGANTRAVRLRKQCGVRMITGTPLPPPWTTPYVGSGFLKLQGHVASIHELPRGRLLANLEEGWYVIMDWHYYGSQTPR